MYLTLNNFNCLRMSKINKRLTNLNFEYFVNYMINYFYPISKIKNFKIELKSDLEGEVYAIYDYYRVIFFNVIFFILNNTRDLKKEKTLTISVKHHIFTENQGSYYKAIFSFTDDSPYIPYNLLNELLNSLKNTELNNITLEKYKLIDFGLIVSFYIANTVYNSEFNVNTLPNSNNHLIVVNILASNTKESNQQTNMQLSQISMQNTIRSIVVTKIFKKPKTMIEELYYNKILAKLYGDNKNNSDSLNNGVLQTKRSSVNLKNRVIKSKNSGNHNDKKTGFNPKELNKKVDKKNPACEGLYDEGMNDSCNIKYFYLFLDLSDEDKENQLILDDYQYREINLTLQNIKINNEKFLNYIDVKNKLNLIKEKSMHLNRKKEILKASSESNSSKSNLNDQNIIKNICIKWDYTLMIENINYCTIPRYLIVEVKNIYY